MSEQSRRHLLPLVWLAGVAVAASVGCDGDDVPATFVGESQHFRLFVATDLAGVDANDTLTALETNWSDTATMLQTPDGQINYYLLATVSEVQQDCNESDIDGCEGRQSVYTMKPVDQHELNHAYMELRTHNHRPAGLIIEGLAEAVGCGEGGNVAPKFTNVPDWRTVVAYSSYEQVYDPGRELVRYLILTQGAASFIDYYAQAPATTDPDTFASNFAAYWNTDLDSVWSAMQTDQPVWGPQYVLPICPCSLPAWTASATPTAIDQSATDPYWTSPALGGDTAVWAGYLGSFSLNDCQRRSLPESAFDLLFAQVTGSTYSPVDKDLLARGSFLSPTCAEAQPYPLPTALLSQIGSASEISLMVSRPPGTDLSVYLSFQPDGPVAINQLSGDGSVEVCPACGSTSGCQMLPRNPSSITLSGQFYLQWQSPGNGSSWPYTSVELLVTPN
jgi:hypothetical protein